jgi:hypothetical protein
MNRAQLRADVRSNLYDSGITFYDDDSINQSLQDAYDKIASECYCIIKSVAVNQVPNQPYYDFKTLGVSDYLGTIAIFNLSTNFWLRDDVSLRDFDRLRRDWEKWEGQPQFWTPHSLKYVAVAPNLSAVTTEQFTLWYWAIAPTFVLDTDVPLVAADMQTLLEYYATADKLEDAEESTKASIWWKAYADDAPQYKQRCLNLAKTDLLLRV